MWVPLIVVCSWTGTIPWHHTAVRSRRVGLALLFVVRSYYRGAKGALIVFDITSHESFENVGEMQLAVPQCSLRAALLFRVLAERG